jgi:glycosyltransferase involved in cell wall biosynthesis
MPHASANILLSAYNGEKFLPRQLDSILAQDFGDFRVLVRDDGSSDGTVRVVRDFARRDPRIVFMNDATGEPPRNMGYRASFLHLLEWAGDSAEFFAFCDQDDFWLPEKVRLGVEALRKVDPARPALYTSSYDFCDADLNRTGEPFADSKAPLFERTLFYNAAFGFTIMGNSALQRIVLNAAPHCPSIPHDKLCAQLALLFGEYMADNRRTALYRRHGKAVTESYGGALALVSSWLRNDIFGETMKKYRVHAAEMLAYLESKEAPPTEALAALRLFSSGKGPASYFKRLLFRKRLRPTLGGELALRISLALGALR